MAKRMTADDILPLVASLTAQERVRLLKLMSARLNSEAAAAYGAIPPGKDEFSTDEEPLDWEAKPNVTSGDAMPLPLPTQDPCYFCAIIEGKADRWNVIEQTDLTLTVLNGRQYEVGQCIVVPIRHAPTLLELTEEDGAAVMRTAKRLIEAIVKTFAPDGVLLYQNNGVGSGQEVPHFHLHVVPRREGSDWGFGPPHLRMLGESIGPPKHNYASPTESKIETITQLRRHLG